MRWTSHKSWKRTAFAATALAVLSLAGCGTPSTTGNTFGQGSAQNQSATGVKQSGSNPNAPFQDLRKSEVMPLDTSFDPSPATAPIYHNITVYNADGKKVTLDASKQPIFFEAYWCPHCQRTLVMLNQNRSNIGQFPVIVSMGFKPGTTVAQAAARSDAELKYFHIKNVKVYFYLGNQTKQLVPKGYPMMVLPHQGQVVSLIGEHTLSVWEQALQG